MTKRKTSADLDLGEPVFEAIAPVLRVLGHPDRLRIVSLLSGGQVTVAEVADTLRLAPNAVSQHLNIMRAHGIVRGVREGRKMYYHVVHPAAASLLQCMRRNAGRV